MPNTKTVYVPHLGGIDAAYQMAKPYDPSLPTLVMINSFMTSSELYRPQFENKSLTSIANLLAIELLGHGQTRAKSPHWTYWDTAIMNLQVLDALKITGKIIVLGTSQGGWVTVRMALLAPEKVVGIIPLGTSMDYESPRSREKGCWDATAIVSARIEAFSSTRATPDFKLQPEQIKPSLEFGFGPNLSEKDQDFWVSEFQKNYAGDDGRKRARMAAINLRDRDGLHGRLPDVTCPVLWLHGTKDVVYSVPNAQEEIKLFTGSLEAQLKVIEGGQHFLSSSNPKEVDEAVVAFVKKYGA